MVMNLFNEWDFADSCSLLILFHHQQLSRKFSIFDLQVLPCSFLRLFLRIELMRIDEKEGKP
jgi:hypothetical protein